MSIPAENDKKKEYVQGNKSQDIEKDQKNLLVKVQTIKM